MAIPLFPLCLVVTKRSVAFCFPGGMPAFRQQYCQRLRWDQFLVAVDVTNGELLEILDELAAGGLDEGEHVAVAGDWGGVYDPAPRGIEFFSTPGPDGLLHWSAEISDYDIRHERRPGRVTWRDPYPGETFLGGSGVIVPLRFDDPPKVRRGRTGGGLCEAMLGAANGLEDALLAYCDEAMKAEGKASGANGGGSDRQG